MKGVIALIPARGGSKRIPQKNIKLLDEVPLVAWSIATARALEIPAYVSSDEKEILRVAQIFGALPWDRPAPAATDDAGDLEVIEDFLKRVEAEVEILLYLRPTTPTRASSVVERAVDLMLKSGDAATSLRSVQEMDESCYKCFTIRNGLLHPVTWQGKDRTDAPQQQVEPTYKPNGYVDIVKPAQVLAGDLWGKVKVPFITRPVVELDTMAEWLYLDYLLKTRGVDEVHEFYLPGGARSIPYGL